MPRHIQHRPATRAPHGSPQFTVYIGGWATEKQKAWLMKHGGSAKLRELIDAAMLDEAAEKARKRAAAATAAQLKARRETPHRSGRRESQDDGGSPVFRAMVAGRM